MSESVEQNESDSNEPKRVLYIERATGWQRLTVPASAKITFGPLIPGAQQSFDGRNGGLYLRVYKTKDHQYAVIPGVKSFRDESIQLANPGNGQWEQVTDDELRGQSVLKEIGGQDSCPQCGSHTRPLGMNSRHRTITGHTLRCDGCGWTG